MPYSPNALNSYTSYTYRIRIFMMPPLTSGYNDYESTGIMIADTASNARYNIQSMDQVSHVGFTVARNSFANSFNIRIAEPNGITLYQTLANAAGTLGVENSIVNAKYIIEISFPGRKEDGVTVGKSGPYAFPVIFAKLDANVTSTGTMYDITAVEISTNTTSFALGATKETIEFSARTVREAIQEFQRKLNDQAQANILSNPNALFRNDYTIELDDRVAGWADWTMQFDDEDQGPNTIRDKRQFAIYGGTSLTEFLRQVFMNTKEFKSFPVITGGYAAPNTEGVTLDFGMKWYFKVVADETDVVFDPLSGTYAKKIRFVIKPHIAPDLVVDASEIQGYISDPSLQITRVQHLLGLGLLKKEYNYLYTGKNTEVINLDIKLENTYYMVAPSMGGQVSSARLGNKLKTSTSRISLINKNGASRPNNTTVTVSNPPTYGGDSLGTASAPEKSAPIPDGQLAYQQLLAEKEAAEIQLGQFKTSISEIYDGLIRRTPDGDLSMSNPTFRGVAQQQLDNTLQLVAPNMSTPQMRPVYMTDGVDSGFTNLPLNDTTTPSVMKFGAALQNLYNSGDMLQIELQIRGDPYWLGQPRSVYGFNAFFDSADFELGANYLFLNTNLPTENGPSKDFMIAGMYRVNSVISEYRNGKFIQYLKAVRDNVVSTESVIAALESGVGVAPVFAPNAPMDGSSPSGSVVQANATSVGDQGDGLRGDPNNPTPFSPEDQTYTPGNHKLDDHVSPALNKLLEQTGNDTGIRVETTSGYRAYKRDENGNVITKNGVPVDVVGSTSGRHQGDASDVRLYYNKTRLDVNNPDHVPYIKEFTQRYHDNAVAQGYTPAVGIGTTYMGGDNFHYDIANTGKQYWGNANAATGAVSWLPGIFK